MCSELCVHNDIENPKQMQIAFFSILEKCNKCNCIFSVVKRMQFAFIASEKCIDRGPIVGPTQVRRFAVKFAQRAALRGLREVLMGGSSD